MSDPHSALYLTDARDLWWNADFLALLATRTGIDRPLPHPTRILDVGAGHGHWTRTIARLVPPGAEVMGLEREAAWVQAASRGPPVQDRTLTFTQGVAEALPFADGGFDVVTCQTLLIHVKDPGQVVAEMLRVLRPGGRLLLLEPNNLAEGVAHLVGRPDFDLDDVVAYFRLQALCEKGKHAQGKGYNSIGESLVSFLDPDLVDEVNAWNNDKCAVFLPGVPHGDHAGLADERRILDTVEGGGTVVWSRDETLDYFLSGGGRGEDFDELWRRARRAALQRIEGLEQGTLANNGGGLFYVLSARKR